MLRKLITTVIGDKRQWREYKARTRRLPPAYLATVEALQRYLNYYGTGGNGMAVLEDLIDLFEQAAASGTPIREVVGEDPVEFIETFVRNYPRGEWIVREQRRLTGAIDRATSEEQQ